MIINQELLTRRFANEFIVAYDDMRTKQKRHYDLKSKARLKPNYPILIKALNDSINAENFADELFNSVVNKPKKPVQYSILDE